MYYGQSLIVLDKINRKFSQLMTGHLVPQHLFYVVVLN